MKKMLVIILEIRENVVTLWSPKKAMGSFQSGQMGQTVNLLSFDFGGSNPSLPTQQHCGSSSVDRASAFQAEGREFEPRLPLNDSTDCDIDVHSRFFVSLRVAYIGMLSALRLTHRRV